MKILSKFIVLSLFLLAVDSASAQTRETRCPRLIGKLSDGTYVPAKGNHMCFSSVREAKRKGFIASESSQDIVFESTDRINLRGYGRLPKGVLKVNSTGRYEVTIARGGKNCSLLGIHYSLRDIIELNSKLPGANPMYHSSLPKDNWLNSTEMYLESGKEYRLHSTLDIPIEVEAAVITCEWYVNILKKN